MADLGLKMDTPVVGGVQKQVRQITLMDTTEAPEKKEYDGSRT